MGIANLVCLSPLVLIYFWGNALAVVAASAFWPAVVTVILGGWRGRQSVSATLIQGAFGALMGGLWLIDGLSTLQSCITHASEMPTAERLDALSYCAESARFWTSTWLTISLAFVTLFGGTLLAMYLVSVKDFGWEAHKEERQILAVLYSVSAIWILVAGFLWCGLPAIKYTLQLSDLLIIKGAIPQTGLP